MTSEVTRVREQLDFGARLGAFASEHGARFYGLPPNRGSVTLTRREQTVPSRMGIEDGNALVPFLASKTLAWRSERS